MSLGKGRTSSSVSLAKHPHVDPIYINLLVKLPLA
jgi:hypothetical protein